MHYLPSRAILILTLLIIGCTVVPMQEMSDARQAMQAARYVKANSITPPTWAKAEQQLTQAEQNLEAGEFKQARKAAILAKKQALNAYHVAIAIQRAKKLWQKLSLITNNMGQTLLEKAQFAALEGKVDKAINLAEKAYSHAKQLNEK
jgi:hypothetical protein